MKILSRFLEPRKEETSPFINDSRRAKRYEIPLKLNYCDPVTKSSGESLTKNICRNGLRFPVNTKFPKGTVLDLDIEDPYSKALIFSKAKVVWMKEFITGDDAGRMIYEIGVKLFKKRLY